MDVVKNKKQRRSDLNKGDGRDVQRHGPEPDKRSEYSLRVGSLREDDDVHHHPSKLIHL